jgi:sigma-B regulation protein RsbU (phosphoserine phosphatase)
MHDRTLRFSGGIDPGWVPAVPAEAGLAKTPDGDTWFEPISGVGGFWVELVSPSGVEASEAGPRAGQVIGAVLAGERQIGLITEELAGRYEEIDLLYAISEILGQTVRLEVAAQTILREVSTVVGARRASIMVTDESGHTLRVVATRGGIPGSVPPVAVDSRESVAARAFRERRVLSSDDDRQSPRLPPAGGDRGYLGSSYLSIPICYAAPGARTRCVGVINLTDRIGGDSFTPGDRKLLAAVANQIGAAIENARLIVRDMQQQRLQHELELAHDLQLKLLPDPAVVLPEAHVAARFHPAESVGGDFYTFTRLGRGRVGVMLGDVSSHGFSAALVMALVISAAGIHASAGSAPDETLAAMLASLSDDLTSTEMYLTAFYGVLNARSRRLVYANAGHQHAFRIPASGPPERLETTAPPLGLAAGKTIRRCKMTWGPSDLLCLWTDGLVDARNDRGEAFGEERLLTALSANRSSPVSDIADSVFAKADAFAPTPRDDRSLLILRI